MAQIILIRKWRDLSDVKEMGESGVHHRPIPPASGAVRPFRMRDGHGANSAGSAGAISRRPIRRNRVALRWRASPASRTLPAAFERTQGPGPPGRWPASSANPSRALNRPRRGHSPRQSRAIPLARRSAIPHRHHRQANWRTAQHGPALRDLPGREGAVAGRPREPSSTWRSASKS